MSMMRCVGTRAHEALLHALEEAVREDDLNRLATLFQESGAGSEEINHKHLLHQAAWQGHPRCVQFLLDYGGQPDKLHKKNGCTPLHLAHFRTIETSNPDQTIRALLAAGADVNNKGKCGRLALDHAIQYQKLDSVKSLLALGSLVTLDCVLLSIDVSNPQILESLFLAGGMCGPMLDSTKYWSRPLERVIYSPLKCPKECYKQMFQMTVQATVCRPVAAIQNEKELKRTMVNVENELRTMSKDSVELARYLCAFLFRAGLQTTDSFRKYAKTLLDADWLDAYTGSPASLKDLCVRIARAHLYACGNVSYGARRLKLPSSVMNHLMLVNPF